MFWFMLIALVVVVGAVALAVLGNGGTLPDTEPDRVRTPLPADRPVRPADLDTLRFAVGWRGYRMEDVDDVLDRVGAELAEREARIAELEAALAGAHDAAFGGPGLTPQQFHPQHYPQGGPDLRREPQQPVQQPQPVQEQPHAVQPPPQAYPAPHPQQAFPPRQHRPMQPPPTGNPAGADEGDWDPWNGKR